MKKYIILLLITTNVGCQEAKIEKYKSFLTGEDYKFWAVDTNYVGNKSPHYVFYDGGKYEFIAFHRNDGQRHRYNHKDLVFIDGIWDFVNDSVMLFGEGRLCKVHFASEEKFVLTPLKGSFRWDTLKLFKHHDQTTPIVNDAK